MYLRYFLFLLLSLHLIFLPVFSQREGFKGEVREFGFIEQALVNQAIENDLEIKGYDRKLSKAGFVRDATNLGASSLKSSIRIIRLASEDSSIRYITNGINLGADVFNVASIGYKIYQIKKVKKQMEDKINRIKTDLQNIFSRLETGEDDVEAKSKLISYVGEKSASDYINWLRSKEPHD